MSAESGKGSGGGIVSKTMRVAVPVLIIVGALIKFGVIAPGVKAPEFLTK